MSYRKWLITTLSLIVIFGALVVAVNFYVDHHAIRLSLFSGNKEIRQTIYPDGINQHTFNPEFIFRHPEKYDSFLFGSSRTTVINVENISEGRFFNMSFNSGLPFQYLAILNAFLKKGVKIKAVVIGLDEFCFTMPASARPKHLLRIMHPDAGGPSRLEFFETYFFRKPTLKELSLWKDRVILGKMKGRFIMNAHGLSLGWLDKDRTVDKAGKPIFNFTVSKYEPVVYSQEGADETFMVIEELIALAREHHFSITFFINPLYSQLYLNHAQPLFTVKERLAKLTDFYDFTGFNSVNTNAMNYLEENHYRFRVGDLIIKRIYGVGSASVSDDFGVLVTRQNINRHLEDQKHELEQYLQTHHLGDNRLCFM